MAITLSPAKAARVVELVREGKTRCEVMEELGVSRLSVERSIGAVPPSERPALAEDFADVDLGRLAALLDHEGLTYTHAARLLGTTTSHVFRLIQSLPAECRPRVERRGASASIDVDAVLKLRGEGGTWPEIGAALGCSADGARKAAAQHRREGRSPIPPFWRFNATDPAGGVPFTPGWECSHEPIPAGSLGYCLGCDSCGYDDRFKSVRKLPPSAPSKADPKRRWSADARSDADKLAEASKGLTRKERRALKFAKGEADKARELVARLSGTGRLDQLEREGDALSRTYGDVGGGVGPASPKGFGFTFGRLSASPAGAH